MGVPFHGAVLRADGGGLVEHVTEDDPTTLQELKANRQLSGEFTLLTPVGGQRKHISFCIDGAGRSAPQQSTTRERHIAQDIESARRQGKEEARGELHATVQQLSQEVESYRRKWRDAEDDLAQAKRANVDELSSLKDEVRDLQSDLRMAEMRREIAENTDASSLDKVLNVVKDFAPGLLEKIMQEVDRPEHSSSRQQPTGRQLASAGREPQQAENDEPRANPPPRSAASPPHRGDGQASDPENHERSASRHDAPNDAPNSESPSIDDDVTPSQQPPPPQVVTIQQIVQIAGDLITGKRDDMAAGARAIQEIVAQAEQEHGFNFLKEGGWSAFVFNIAQLAVQAGISPADLAERATPILEVVDGAQALQNVSDPHFAAKMIYGMAGIEAPPPILHMTARFIGHAQTQAEPNA